MESQVAAAGAAETEAEAGKRPAMGSASQGSLVSAPKGAVRWQLLRQVRAGARLPCLWPLPSQVAGAPRRREAPSCFINAVPPHPPKRGKTLAGLESGTAQSELSETQKILVLACLMGGTACLHRVLLCFPAPLPFLFYFISFYFILCFAS